jgi:hypothetical protein
VAEQKTRYDLWDRYMRGGYDGSYGPFYDLEEAKRVAQERANGNRAILSVDIVQDQNSQVLVSVYPTNRATLGRD